MSKDGKIARLGTIGLDWAGLGCGLMDMVDMVDIVDFVDGWVAKFDHLPITSAFQRSVGLVA
jgi:hypothetical protein